MKKVGLKMKAGLKIFDIRKPEARFCAVILIGLLAFGVSAAAQEDPYIPVRAVRNCHQTGAATPAAYMTDGNMQTCWRLKPGAASGWAELTLEETALIYGLELDGSLASGTSLVVEYEKDGAWLPFLGANLQTIPADGRIDLSYDRAVTSKLRLRLTGAGTDNSRLNELKIRGQSARSVKYRLTPQVIALSDNTSSFYPVEHLTDQNTYTTWRTIPGAGTGTVLFELPQEHTLANINLYFTGEIRGDFRFEVPEENDNWRQVAAITGRPEEGWQRLDLSAQAVATQKLRLTVTGSGELGGLGEVELWGYGAYSGDNRRPVGGPYPQTLINPLNLTFELEKSVPEPKPVIPPSSLQVLYRTVNPAPVINNIQHHIRLVNTGALPLDLSTVKLRYWYTKEPAGGQQAHIYWSDIGQQHITAEFKPAGYPGANHYLEIGFTKGAGILGPGSAIEVQLGFNAVNWQNYTQSDDYSFDGKATAFTANNRYTGYINGSLAWGIEPSGAAAPAPSGWPNIKGPVPGGNGPLQLLYKSTNTALVTNNIQHSIRLVNTGAAPVDLSTIKLRYWYTSEPFKQQTANIYWANIGQHNITTRFCALENITPGADHYLEISFTRGAGYLNPGATAEIQLGFNTTDWSNYNQENDYSFNGSGQWQENHCYTVYQNNQLIWGAEPVSPAFAPVTDLVPKYRLELSLRGGSGGPLTVELNGHTLEAPPVAVLRDQTLYSLPLPAGCLWDGTNYLRILPPSSPATVTGVIFAESNCDGEQEYAGTSLNDRLLLTPVPSGSEEKIILPALTLLEKAVLYAEGESCPPLQAWTGKNWQDLTPVELLPGRVIYGGPAITGQLRLGSGFLPISELQVWGSAVTDRAPELRILWPAEHEEIDLAGWENKTLTGFVDNPAAQVTVNGAPVEKNGHYFSVKLGRLGLTPWEENLVVITAEDPQGRRTTRELLIALGKFVDYELNLPEEIIHTDKESIEVNGRIYKDQYKVSINDQPVPVTGGSFRTTVALQEGFNRIRITFTNEEKGFSRTVYRQVVRHSGPVRLTIETPLSGAYLNDPEITVSGTVQGMGELQVTVNGVPAVVTGGFYQAFIHLDEGENLLVVEAADAKGQTARQELSVILDTKPPVVEDLMPPEGSLIARAEVEVTGKVIDASPVWVYINGQPAVVETGGFRGFATMPDGTGRITIHAEDQAGNIAYFYIEEITIDTTPPLPFTVHIDPEGWTNNTQPVLTFSTSDETSGISHYELAINDGEFIRVTSPYQLEPQPDGEHIITVKAVDRAGWSTTSTVTARIDTTPPEVVPNFRVVPGKTRMVLKWDKPSPDTVQYLLEKSGGNGVGVVEFVVDGEKVEYIDDGLPNGAAYQYRLRAVDRAGNIGLFTVWEEGITGLAYAPYEPGQGAVVEYDGAILVLPQSGLPEEIVEIQVTEVSSEHLEEKAIYPRVTPIYEFGAVREGESEPMESVSFENGYLVCLEYDETKLPEGFPEHNLGVYYYDPMFDRWFLIEGSGVDVENNRIYFLTNHFSSFTVQATIIQDLSPQEYKEAGYSPLKSYAEHGGITVSPQGGIASTRVTELVLPGRNGFDLVLSRHYDTATARNDAFAMAIGGKIGINLNNPGQGLRALEEIKDIFSSWQKFGEWLKGEFFDQVIDILEQYLFNQGDFAYSMGQGWRLNIPYVKAANSTLILCTAEGAMHAINEMEIVSAGGIPGYREFTLKQSEGDDFTLTVQQVNSGFDVTHLIREIIGSGDSDGAKIKTLHKTRWYSTGYVLRMKDGTQYEMDALGRTTKITDPSGLNKITFKYNGMQLDYIEDSIGRRVRFEYETHCLIPRIKKIWVENDPYNRTIRYKLESPGFLMEAIDAGGRVSKYDYDLKLLLGGTAGCTINILEIIGKLIANLTGLGWLTGLFGDDIVLYGNFQAQVVCALEEMSAPGQGYTRIDYTQESIMYGKITTNYLNFLGIKIPKSITFSGHLEQRLLTSFVYVYNEKGGTLIKQISYTYDVEYYDHGQPFISQTVENDGKRKTIYKYKAMERSRYCWEDRYVDLASGGTTWEDAVLKAWFPLQFWRVDVLSVNHETEIRDAQTNAPLEVHEKEYDTRTLRPVKQEVQRGENYHRVEYTYDNWGNITYIHDYDKAHGRKTQSETWMYYANTDSQPLSTVLSTAPAYPYSQPDIKRFRYNLLLGKAVKNYAPEGFDELTDLCLFSYHNYNELGQLIGTAQWDGESWLFTEYAFHPDHGSLVRKVNPEGHVTEYEYDSHGLPTAVIEKAVRDAAGQTADLITRMQHEHISGWKLWERNPRGYVTAYEYDSLGRTTRIIAPDDDDHPEWLPGANTPQFRENNPETTIEYDDTDLYSIVTDPLGNRTKYDFDPLGRLTEIIKYKKNNGQYEPAAVTGLQYDGWGNIIAITDPNGHTTNYEYDAMNRNTRIIFPADSGSRPEKQMTFNYTTNTLTILDEEGHRTIELYDMQDRLLERTQYNGAEEIRTRIYYDGLGNEVVTVDPKGSRTVKIYNALNLLEKILLPEEKFWENGQEVTVIPYQRFEYNKAGHKILEARNTFRGEQITRHEVDGLGRVIRTKMTYTDSGVAKEAVTEYYYDGNGNLVKMVDANNTPLPPAEQKAFVYTYSATDLVLSETDPAGNSTTYTYDKAGNLTSMTDPRGNSELYDGDFTIIYEYDDLNRLVAGYLPMSPGETVKPVVRLVYDARGNLLERIEPDGGRTKYEYTPRNWVKTTTVQGGGKTYVTQHYYDKAGNEIRTVDPRGYETRREYDALSRLVQVIYPAGNREWFEYDENGNRTAYTDGRLNRTEYKYDRYNRLVETRDANGGTTKYFYDRWGNMTRMINPLGHVFRYDYDELDRLIQETDSLGYVKKYRYDAVGNRIYSKDPNGTESIYEYYPNNLVKKISMKNGAEEKTLEYWYDEAGYRRRVRDDDIELVYNTFAGKYIPDPFGRIRRETRNIDGRSFSVDYTYDVMGRITGIKYPTGQEVTYQYNSIGELTGMPGYLSGAPTYDQGGLLTGLTAANGIAMTRAYDQNARLQNLGYKDPQAALKEYQYTYDGANNIIQRNEDQFQYDALNQLVFARLEGSFEIGPENDDQRQGRTLEDYYGAKQLEFTALPEILELDYAAGSIGVDLRGEFPVTRVELTPGSPVHRVKPRHLMVYVSNDNSSYTEVKDWEAATGAGGKMVITFATPVTTRFIKVQCQFDDRDREYRPVNRAEFKHKPEELIKVYYTVTSRYEEYAYDASGNRVQERITLRMTETRNYSYYPNSSRLRTNGVYGFVYDANGNLIRKGTSFTITGNGIELKDEGEYWEYRYDLLNRLTEVKKNGSIVARYWYDETGLRVKKESGNGTIYYVFNLEGQVLYEEENQGYVEYIYLLGRHFARVDGYRTAITEERITYFYHTDHLGSTVLVTDETGATVWSTEYTPFGSLTFAEGKLKRAAKFTGKDLDEDTGLYYFNARWYDQEIGRFISEDPIKDGMNWYTYANNNPLKYIDPTGLYGWEYHVELFDRALKNNNLMNGTGFTFTKADFEKMGHAQWTIDYITNAVLYPTYHFRSNHGGGLFQDYDARIKNASEHMKYALFLNGRGARDQAMTYLGFGGHMLQDMFAHGDIWSVRHQIGKPEWVDNAIDPKEYPDEAPRMKDIFPNLAKNDDRFGVEMAEKLTGFYLGVFQNANDWFKVYGMDEHKLNRFETFLRCYLEYSKKRGFQDEDISDPKIITKMMETGRSFIQLEKGAAANNTSIEDYINNYDRYNH